MQYITVALQGYFSYTHAYKYSITNMYDGYLNSNQKCEN